MLEQEADKDWAISRWLDEVERKTGSIVPEVHTSVSRAYQLAYMEAIRDFRAFLSQIGVYRR